MIKTSVDIAILGSGLGGSLMALILERLGRSVVLVDRAAHPRFAIGESSTPIADYILADLADRYDLPRLKPLAKYGSWTATYPEIGRGLKRGFSYFRHTTGRAFESHADHSTELLVAASSSDERADTHWLRSDVDAFLVGEVRAAGIEVLEQTTLNDIRHDDGWCLRGERHAESVEIRARFVIDATGPAAVIPRALGIEDDGAALRTNSRAVFGHFAGLRTWHDVLTESDTDVTDHPFPCDAAALHHILDDGWMWQLRFDNGITSAGFVFDAAARPSAQSVPPVTEWNDELAKYPSIARQFEAATLVQPEGGLQHTGRLQRCVRQAAGEDWALLPNTAGFIDPLHSTGIAHTLSGIERLAGLFEVHWNGGNLSAALRVYSQQLRNEITWIDQLVEGCYAARSDFRAFTAWSMLYFAAATTCEHRRVENGAAAWSFLCADDTDFRKIVRRLREQLDRTHNGAISIAGFEEQLRKAIAPFNSVGLCDPSARNMYRYTVAPA